MATSPAERRPALDRDIRVDAAVLGAGITGLSAALLLRRAGLEVAVLDQSAIASGASGYTTAKLSSLHGLTYAGLRASLGIETARAYAEANEFGLRRIADWAEELN